MPWDVVKSGSGWQVKDKHGKVMGTHKTREKALRQLRALYANVPEARKEK